MLLLGLVFFGWGILSSFIKKRRPTFLGLALLLTGPILLLLKMIGISVFGEGTVLTANGLIGAGIPSVIWASWKDFRIDQGEGNKIRTKELNIPPKK